MLDVQNQQDDRDINIQRVGVKKVHIPLQILERTGTYQTVTAEISLCADLSKDVRGYSYEPLYGSPPDME